MNSEKHYVGRKTRPKAVRSKPHRRSFSADFASLEESLRAERKLGEDAVVMTPERMIIELGWTPQGVARIEDEFGRSFPWFKPTYLALRRHGLLKQRTRSWENWLRIYRRKRAAAEKHDPKFETRIDKIEEVKPPAGAKPLMKKMALAMDRRSAQKNVSHSKVAPSKGSELKRQMVRKLSPRELGRLTEQLPRAGRKRAIGLKKEILTGFYGRKS